jgi:hypothetical protein
MRLPGRGYFAPSPVIDVLERDLGIAAEMKVPGAIERQGPSLHTDLHLSLMRGLGSESPNTTLLDAGRERFAIANYSMFAYRLREQIWPARGQERTSHRTERMLSHVHMVRATRRARPMTIAADTPVERRTAGPGRYFGGAART